MAMGRHTWISFIHMLKGAAAGVATQSAYVTAAHSAWRWTISRRPANEPTAAGATSQGKIADVSTGSVAGRREGNRRDPTGIIIELL